MSLFLSAIGLMMVFEGILCFCLPEQVKSFTRKFLEMPDGTLRVIGFCCMMAGLLVVYFGGDING